MNVTDKITITNEDNMLLMARYPDNYFDLAIVDPPYSLNIENSGTMFKKFGDTKGWDNEIPNKKYFDELFRVSKNQIIWGGNYFINHLKNTKCIIWWDKMNGTNMMADGEIAWTSFDKHCKRFSMHHFSNGYDNKIHPTQKPTKLYKWILDNYAQSGNKILDTHLGSGSIAIACQDYGFELTACELDKEYYDKAIQRIQNHTNQTKLF
jgi:site-specific DNA-methyltransferase (adenine-specific)